MKRFFKFIGIAVAVILLALIAIPFIFQGKIKEIALEEANKMLNSEVYINDVSLSFFKNFPHASVTLNTFGVAGKNEFKGDTLAKADELTVVIGTMSLFTDKYEIEAINLKDADINAIVKEDGKANWDIMKEDTTASTSDTSASTPFALSLDEMTLENINVKYTNYQNGSSANVGKLNLNMAGDLSSDSAMFVNIKDLALDVDTVAYADSSMEAGISKLNFTFAGEVSEAISKLKSKLGASAVNFTMQHIPYLSNAVVNADINVDADLKNNKYTLGENTVAINAINASLSGFVQLVDSTTTDMDLKFSTNKLQFKDILSMIPAIYKNNFDKIKTDGKVTLAATAKGRLKGDSYPAFDVKMVVENSMFKYPDLPKQVDNINIAAEVTNPGGNLDNTVVNVSNFSLSMANNPFAAHLILKTPISDPDFDFGVKGTIDFNSIKDFISLPDMKLSGILTADASAAGRLSYVNNKQYDKFKVAGNLNVKDMKLSGKAIGYDVNVLLANLNFSNQALDLTACNLNIGKDDLELKGKLTNFLPYLLSDGTIKGNLSVNSSYFNVNDFLSADASESTATTDTASSATSSIDIPGNIDFAMNLNMAKVLYDNIELDQVKGAMTVKDKVATISNLSTNTMEGSLTMKGSYDSKVKDNSAFSASMNVKQMSIPKVFSTVNTAKKFVPLLSNASGKFNMAIDLNSKLDATLSPVLNTVNAKGSFKTASLTLQEFETLKKIASATKYAKAAENRTLKNVDIKFTIKDGRMTTQPFSVKLGESTMNVSGSSELDETLDYKAAMAIPNSVSTKLNIPLNFNILIGGTFNKPTVKVDASSVVQNVKEVAKETAKKVVNKALEEAKAQQTKMLAEANKKAAALKSTAEAQGDKLIAEAQAKADKEVANSKNALEKKVKQKAADKLIDEAKKKKAKLVADAETQGNKIISDAQTKSDKLIQDAQTKTNAQ